MEKKQTELSDDNKIIYREELDQLAKIIADIKNLKVENSSTTDPFDEYKESMSCKIFADASDFRSRFVKGYNALINQLRNCE